MFDQEFPHGLLPPPKPYAKWEGAGGDPLVYLGWGERDFSLEAIETHSNPGWTYWVLIKGRVRAKFAEESRFFETGEGLICGPGVAFGFPKQAMQPASILVWIWRDPPTDLKIADPVTCDRVAFSGDEIKLLEALHRLTRFDNLAGALSRGAVLIHTRALLESLFLRAADPERENKTRTLLESARQWMLDHLVEHNPVEPLSRYLNLSAISLHRLFRRETGLAPGAYFQGLKLERCARLLETESYSVKRVAYEMGYRHPNDFSRAFKRYFGVSPRNWKQKAAPS